MKELIERIKTAWKLSRTIRILNNNEIWLELEKNHFIRILFFSMLFSSALFIYSYKIIAWGYQLSSITQTNTLAL